MATAKEEDSCRPEVIVDFAFHCGVFHIIVENIGTAPAYRVSVKFSRKFHGLGGRQEMSGLRLSEATAGRTTEAAGGRLKQLRGEGRTLGSPRSWDWHKDAKGRTCAYASIDAICVAQQAKGGGKAEGRMPYVAAIYNPVPEEPDKAAGLPVPGYEPVEEGPAAADALPGAAAKPRPKRRMQARYVAGLMSLAALGLVLRQQAAQVDMEAAQLWIALSDGGNGLEEFLRGNFNRADLVVILDFWHAAGYLEKLALASRQNTCRTYSIVSSALIAGAIARRAAAG